jgi:hypothetical protein
MGTLFDRVCCLPSLSTPMTARILIEAPTNAAKGWTAKPVRPARRRRPLLGVCTAPTNGIDAASIAAMHIKISRDRKPVIVLAAVKGKALSRRPKWPPLTAAARDALRSFAGTEEWSVF